MGHPSKEPSGGKTPSAKSLNELMDLLLKLNAQLREKISPSRKKGELEAENTEMVVIILNHTPGTPSPKIPRPPKPKPMKNDWIDGLCEEIEGGSSSRKNS